MDNNEKFILLNRIYKPIYTISKKINAALIDNGYSTNKGYYPLHSVKKDDEFATEYFPIPVITVENICDIGIDIDKIFIEFKMNRDEAIIFDFSTFNDYQFEIYCADDYLLDFYNETIDINSISDNIKKSTEEQVAISIYLDNNTNPDKILEIISLLNNIYRLNVSL